MTTIGVTGPRGQKIKIGYHNGYNVFVKWRLRQLSKTYLNHYGPSKVITGVATGFDTAIAEACIELAIPFVAAVPFQGQELKWSLEEQRIYQHIIAKAAEVKVVCEGPFANWKFQKRNEYIVDNSEMMLALWNKEDKGSGTDNCVKYAYEVGVPIVNLWSNWERHKESRFPFSNFQKVSIIHEEETYPSVENFYQAMKTKDEFIRHRFTMITSVEAKQYGKTIEVREDWDEVKDKVMTYGLKQKFSQSPYYQQLVESGTDELIEWNTWHDNYWGWCYCNKCTDKEHHNKLGKMIMEIREVLE